MSSANLKVRCLSAGLATVWLGAANVDAPAQVVDYGADQGSSSYLANKVVKFKKKATKKKAAKKATKVKKVTEGKDLKRKTTALPDFEPADEVLEFQETIVLDESQSTNFLFTNIYGLSDSNDVLMLFSDIALQKVTPGTTQWTDLFSSTQRSVIDAISLGDESALSDFLFESSSITGIVAVVPTAMDMIVPDALGGTMIGFDGGTGVAFENGEVLFDAQVVPEPGASLMIGGLLLSLGARRSHRAPRSEPA